MAKSIHALNSITIKLTNDPPTHLTAAIISREIVDQERILCFQVV